MSAALAPSRSRERHGTGCALLVLSTFVSKHNQRKARCLDTELEFSSKGDIQYHYLSKTGVCRLKWESPSCRRTRLVTAPWGSRFSYYEQCLCSCFFLSHVRCSLRQEWPQQQQQRAETCMWNMNQACVLSCGNQKRSTACRVAKAACGEKWAESRCRPCSYGPCNSEEPTVVMLQKKEGFRWTFGLHHRQSCWLARLSAQNEDTKNGTNHSAESPQSTSIPP